ncbi:CHRD domain-containing protein [Spirosoma rigui]|uniref:CHRD domain-containing protein n=1 Tax=Spirosoma rigui TaxID=564064 RepID=UPI0009B0CC24|nr:CHRD domain-containing protein [Spirosoma rigui]
MNKKNALFSVAALLAMGLTLTSCSKDDVENPVVVAPDQYTATIDGKSEKPTSTTSTAIGAFNGKLNETTRTLSYTVTYSGMTPTMGHLHRISKADGTGNPEITFPSLTSPITGSTTLTQSKMDSLKNGFYYVNLHSTAYPNGEIRGDIKK